jgi:hypothetical protein
MLQVIRPVDMQRRIQRRAAQPVADELVHLRVLEEGVVGAVMVHHAECQQPPAKDDDAEQDRRRVRPDDGDGKRARNQRPGKHERSRRPQVRLLPQVAQLVF